MMGRGKNMDANLTANATVAAYFTIHNPTIPATANKVTRFLFSNENTLY